MIKLLLATIAVAILMSCDDPGTTVLLLNGTEKALPDELKGLRVYKVAIDSCDTYINVAVMTGSTAIGAPRGVESVVVDNGWDAPRSIKVSEIIFENDTMIMARKSPK